MNLIILSILLFISILESVAHYAIIAQTHDLTEKMQPAFRYNENKLVSQMNRIWHVSFFFMWVAISALILINNPDNWWQVVLIGLLRLALFPTAINIAIDRTLFPRSTDYLSDKGIDGFIKNRIGEKPFFVIKWCALWSFILFVIFFK